MITGRLQKPPLWYRLFRVQHMLRFGIWLELLGPLLIVVGTLWLLYTLAAFRGRLIYPILLLVAGGLLIKYRMQRWREKIFLENRTIQRFWYDQRMLGYTLPISYKIRAKPVEELIELTEFKGIAGYWLLRFSDGDLLCLKVHTERAASLMLAIKADLGMLAPVGADDAVRIG